MKALMTRLGFIAPRESLLLARVSQAERERSQRIAAMRQTAQRRLQRARAQAA